MYAALRDTDPVHHVDTGIPGQDYWVLSRHADVWSAARDHETFSSARGLTVNYGELELIGLAENPPMVMQDPPARQPGGRLMKRINDHNIAKLRTNGGTFMGQDALVLVTLGAKSGVERWTPVAWFPDSDHSWIVVASANGAARNPAWYHNLAAHPDSAAIELAGRRVPVRAEQLHGNARDHAWRAILARVPRFADYERKTDRVIPVIRLRARSEGTQ